ncbi:metallophosphoesterase family protein [Parageobacillus thermoglucosidasius]|uniref:Phosphoesterase n=1 Tax=Parageobacillus thermoglucosidasius TaxID=1426 RepID=A0AB38QUR6_PARTM|nr:metallophosphoesterase [Parageobacillus thermoglucosidasius]UOE75581.1 metallophosphoesterase [Parageobacillus thermoglucosidasius]
MKVLIISDSHGLTEELEEIAARHRHEADALIHCGDSELSTGHKEIEHFLIVRGNCDFTAQFPKERIEEIGGIRFFITHGHLYNVKMSLMNLYYRAKEIEAKVVCFGHSHIAGAELIDGILFINPGSILLPRTRKEKTYALLQIEDGEATVRFYEVDGKEVHSLTKAFAL